MRKATQHELEHVAPEEAQHDEVYNLDMEDEVMHQDGSMSSDPVSWLGGREGSNSLDK